MRFRRLAPLFAAATTALAVCSATRAAEDKASLMDIFSPWRWEDLVDRWPDMLDQYLPSLKPSGAVKVYVRPHFGDFYRKDYVRIPVGVRVKATERIELSTEVEGYITHGFRDSYAERGFSSVLVGSKYEQPLSCGPAAAFSTGLNFRTPLSRPPAELTDGKRHTQPYVAMTRPLIPQWKVVGFGTLGADLLASTGIAPRFGKNQLHANSLGVALGAARDWPRFNSSVTLGYQTTSLIADENKSVISLRPEVVVPFYLGKSDRVRWFLTCGARAIHGPDGNEYGVSSSLRVEFQNRRKTKSP